MDQTNGPSGTRLRLHDHLGGAFGYWTEVQVLESHTPDARDVPGHVHAGLFRRPKADRLVASIALVPVLQDS